MKIYTPRNKHREIAIGEEPGYKNRANCYRLAVELQGTMKVWHFLVVVCSAVLWRSTSCQTVGSCNGGALYACVSKYHYQDCTTMKVYNSTTSEFPVIGPVCYPGYDVMIESDKIMQGPPPACTTRGAFSLHAITGRCDQFYVCMPTGRAGEYNWAINSCRAPNEFSETEHKCVDVSLARCSIIPTTTTTTTQAPCVPGVRTADSTNCRNYLDCTSTSPTATVTPCPFNYFFNDVSKTCSSDSAVCNGRPFAAIKASVANKINKRGKRNVAWFGNLVSF